VLAAFSDIEGQLSLPSLDEDDGDGNPTLEPMVCDNLSPIRGVEPANESMVGADNKPDDGERNEDADVDNDADGATHDDEGVDANCEDGDDAEREADDEDVDEGGVDGDDDESAPARVEYVDICPANKCEPSTTIAVFSSC
jgi:hypothetical protein